MTRAGQPTNRFVAKVDEEGVTVTFEDIEFIECPCCRGKGSTWPEKRGYQCVMCHGENVIDAEREPEWDHIVSSAG